MCVWLDYVIYTIPTICISKNLVGEAGEQFTPPSQLVLCQGNFLKFKVMVLLTLDLQRKMLLGPLPFFWLLSFPPVSQPTFTCPPVFSFPSFSIPGSLFPRKYWSNYAVLAELSQLHSGEPVRISAGGVLHYPMYFLSTLFPVSFLSAIARFSPFPVRSPFHPLTNLSYLPPHFQLHLLFYLCPVFSPQWEPKGGYVILLFILSSEQPVRYIRVRVCN